MRAKRQSESPAISVQGERSGPVSLAISGRIALDTLKSFLSEVTGLLGEMAPSELTVDLSAVEYLDSAGALALVRFKREAVSRSIPLEFINVTEEARGIIELIDRGSTKGVVPLPARKSRNIFEQVGEGTVKVFHDFVTVMTNQGEILKGLVYSIFHPRSVRWGDVLYYMKTAGVDGLPIVGLISFLLGLIIAFMSSLQLEQFGANIYVASLVGIAMVKELGPIMTAILVAGRSGSSFAAEIGTMMVNEEVDALTTMGYDPVRFLAVPKVLAAMFVVPLLTLYADLLGIVGGMIIGVAGLDLTVFTYVKQTQQAVTMFDFVTSLIKSGVFAVIIAGIGCQRGFQVKGGPLAVGQSTTSAVVSAIFFIVVVDSAFAILFYYIR